MSTQRPLKEFPKRGEIYIADLDPAFGREIHKKRPVLIISNNLINQVYSVVITIPFSSIVPEYIGADVVKFINQKGLDKESVLIVNQIRSIDQARILKKIGKVSQIKLEEVEVAINAVFGLNY